MSPAAFVILFMLALWGVIAAIVLALDAANRRRYHAKLELRDWAEKVEAMKRLQDQEGDA